MYPKLTDEQIEAIVLWKEENGYHWKDKLFSAWIGGNYHGFRYSNILQYLRNSRGPSWLNSFNLKKALLRSNLIQVNEKD